MSGLTRPASSPEDHTATFPPDVQSAIGWAERSGRELLQFWRKPPADLSVVHKGDRDVVTAADRRSESLILDGIQRDFPGDAWLAEESGYSTGAESSTLVGSETDSPLWIIDPLDGTTNFTHGHPLFSVSIARSQRRRVDLAVVHAPVLGETYVAWQGGGAYRNGRRIRVAEVGPLSDALLATGFSYRRRELDHGGLNVWDRLLRTAREIRRGGSACLDLAHTAAGIFQGYWEYYLAPHDVAAGSLLVSEAGGTVTDCSGGDDFVWGRSVIAGNASTYRELRAVLDELGPTHPGEAL